MIWVVLLIIFKPNQIINNISLKYIFIKLYLIKKFHKQLGVAIVFHIHIVIFLTRYCICNSYLFYIFISFFKNYNSIIIY